MRVLQSYSERHLRNLPPAYSPYPTPTPTPAELRALRREAREEMLTLLAIIIFCILVHLINRYKWRHPTPTYPRTPPPNNPPATAQIKKSIKKNRLPISSYGKKGVNMFQTECPICLIEFVKGDEVRVLPTCKHGFHVRCIDTWLLSSHSCPNCRLPLVQCGPARNWRGGGAYFSPSFLTPHLEFYNY